MATAQLPCVTPKLAYRKLPKKRSKTSKNIVDFQPNFDESLKEPTVLPTRIPNLLVNGASGIAVGMATNMPPHNLIDTIDAINAYIDNSDIEIDDLIDIIKAPDFPTGGIIYGYQGVKESYQTGRGRIIVRGKANIETLATAGKLSPRNSLHGHNKVN